MTLATSRAICPLRNGMSRLVYKKSSSFYMLLVSCAAASSKHRACYAELACRISLPSRRSASETRMFEVQRMRTGLQACLDLATEVDTTRIWTRQPGLSDWVVALHSSDQTVTRLRQSKYCVLYRARQAVNMLAKANFRIAKHIEHDMQN